MTKYTPIREAVPDDFKSGALLQYKKEKTLARIERHIRGDEFEAIVDGVTVPIALHSREANWFYLIESGNQANSG